MASEDRSAVQGQEQDIRRQEYQRKIVALHAAANIASSQRKSAPPDNHPPPVPLSFMTFIRKKETTPS